MKTLNERNTEIVEQVIKEQNEKILEQQKRIDLLSRSVSSLAIRLTEIERNSLLDKARSAGTGSTGPTGPTEI